MSSPDGAIAQLPLAALPAAQPDQYLIHDYAFVTIAVPQMLPQMLANDIRARDAPEPEASPQDASLLLIGDVDYGGNAGEAESEDPSRPDTERIRSAVGMRFRPLPNTFDEISSVASRFRRQYRRTAEILDQELATESAFRQLAPRHRWLHIATHGFFAPKKLFGSSKDETSDGAGR